MARRTLLLALHFQQHDLHHERSGLAEILKEAKRPYYYADGGWTNCPRGYQPNWSPGGVLWSTHLQEGTRFLASVAREHH